MNAERTEAYDRETPTIEQRDPDDDDNARPAWTPEAALASALRCALEGTPFGERS